MIDDGLTEDERDNLLHEVHHLSHMLAERDEEIKRLSNENALLEKWNGEIAFNARLFAEALKDIIILSDDYDKAVPIARAALGGAND